MTRKKIPIIFDCDPGIDDAIALTVAFAHAELDIKAVTTVAGNVPVDRTTRAARTVLSVLGVHNKIYAGAKGPLLGGEPMDASDVHGESGLGTFCIDENRLHPLEEEPALEIQRKLLETSSEPLTIIATGPLTNIAILLLAYPELKTKIARISLMGGGLYSGNHTAAAEFNILADPEAAQIVFQSGIPLIMAGLDVTHKAFLTKSNIDDIASIKTPVGEMIASMLQFSTERYGKTNDVAKRVCIHDAVSVLALLSPDIVHGKELHVVVETAGVYCRGYTLADQREGVTSQPNAHVLLDIDHEKFFDSIVESIQFYK